MAIHSANGQFLFSDSHDFVVKIFYFIHRYNIGSVNAQKTRFGQIFFQRRNRMFRKKCFGFGYHFNIVFQTFEVENIIQRNFQYFPVRPEMNMRVFTSLSPADPASANLFCLMEVFIILLTAFRKRSKEIGFSR